MCGIFGRVSSSVGMGIRGQTVKKDELQKRQRLDHDKENLFLDSEPYLKDIRDLQAHLSSQRM